MGEEDPLTWLESVLLGAVQGITEFLPVSSDGHLVLGRYLLDYQKDLLVFDVLLHLGTLGSLLFVFSKHLEVLFRDTKTLLREIISSKSLNCAFDKRFKAASYIWITTFVTGVMGLLFEKTIEGLFASIEAASFGFLITSAFLFLASWKNKGLSSVVQMPLVFPFVIGFVQSMALLPGVSRSGLTIATALVFSVHRREAGDYSFLAAIPIIFLASVYQSRHLLGGEHADISIIAVGILTSFVFGVLALRLLLWILREQSLLPFALYTLALGVFGLSFL